MFRSTSHPACRLIMKVNEVFIPGEGTFHYYFANIPRGCLTAVKNFEYIASSGEDPQFLGVIITKLEPVIIHHHPKGFF